MTTVATDAGALARTPAQVAQDTILVLDFGSQYSQLIARRVREAGVYCELIPGTTPWEAMRDRAPSALILSGGPASVYEDGAPRCDPAALNARLVEAGVPVRSLAVHRRSLEEIVLDVTGAGSDQFGVSPAREVS